MGQRTGPLEVGAIELCNEEWRQTMRNVLKASEVRVGCRAEREWKRKRRFMVKEGRKRKDESRGKKGKYSWGMRS